MAAIEIDGERIVEVVVGRTLLCVHPAEDVQIAIGVHGLMIGTIDFAIVVERHVFANLHFCGTGSGTAGIVVIEIVGKFERSILILAQIFDFGQPVAVAGFVMDEKRKRTCLVAIVIQPRDGLVGDDVGEVALLLILSFGIDEARIVVVTLSREDVPVVKTRRGTVQVPLSDDGGLIACGLQQFGHRLLRTVKDAMFVVSKSVFVRMLSGEHASTRGPAQRVGHIGAGKAHPILRHSVEVGSVDIARVVGRKHLGGVVVGHDVDDIVALLCCRNHRHQTSYKRKKFCFH